LREDSSSSSSSSSSNVASIMNSVHKNSNQMDNRVNKKKSGNHRSRNNVSFVYVYIIYTIVIIFNLQFKKPNNILTRADRKISTANGRLKQHNHVCL
jgi:hypothetical protein